MQAYRLLYAGALTPFAISCPADEWVSPTDAISESHANGIISSYAPSVWMPAAVASQGPKPACLRLKLSYAWACFHSCALAQLDSCPCLMRATHACMRSRRAIAFFIAMHVCMYAHR